jgi:hypothetical protein
MYNNAFSMNFFPPLQSFLNTSATGVNTALCSLLPLTSSLLSPHLISSNGRTRRWFLPLFNEKEEAMFYTESATGKIYLGGFDHFNRQVVIFDNSVQVSTEVFVEL